MANTFRESTAPDRGDNAAFPSESVPLSTLDNNPLTCTVNDPACQEVCGLALPIGECSVTSILKAVDTTFDLHLSANGSTVSLAGGNLATRELFAVSIYPERSVELALPPTWRQLLTFALQNLDLLMKVDHAIGTWLDDRADLHVLDVVICIPDRMIACELGMRCQQWSIFNLASDEEIQIAPDLRPPGPCHIGIGNG